MYRIFSANVCLFGLLCLGGVSCDTNLYEGLAPEPETVSYQLEQARVHLDNKEYQKALAILTPLEEDPETDTNDGRILYVAASLGLDGLDLWSIFSELMENGSFTDIGEVLASASSATLGTGETKALRLTALQSSIQRLQSAPQPDDAKIDNTSCYLGGLIVAPMIADATTTLTSLQTQLSSISPSNCSSTALTDTIAEAQTLSTRFSLVTSLTQSCSILSLDTTAADSIGGILNNLLSNADKGCSAPPVGSESLFPQCFQDQIGAGASTTASANDKLIAQCEIVYHCYNPTACF